MWQTVLRVVLCTMLLITLVSCSLGGTPPASTQTPPLYQNAQQVIVQQTKGSIRNVQKIFYQTQAPSKAIKTFYEAELRKDDWEFESDLSSANQLYFSWIGGRNPNIPTFELMVVITETSRQLTNVELILTEEIPR